MALSKKKKVIIAVAALAVIGGVGSAIGNSTTEEATAPMTAAPAPDATTTEPPAPATESSAPVEEPAPTEEATVQVADQADPADIETVLSGFPGDGEGYVVLASAAAEHEEGTVVGLEIETPNGTTERGVWILFNNGSVQAANSETVEGTSASWPVRKDARYALDDEVISVDTTLGAN